MDTYSAVMVVRRRLVLIEEMKKWRALALVSIILNVVSTVIFLMGGAQ